MTQDYRASTYIRLREGVDPNAIAHVLERSVQRAMPAMEREPFTDSQARAMVCYDDPDASYVCLTIQPVPKVV